jgi:hypothetical protein
MLTHGGGRETSPSCQRIILEVEVVVREEVSLDIAQR